MLPRGVPSGSSRVSVETSRVPAGISVHSGKEVWVRHYRRRRNLDPDYFRPRDLPDRRDRYVPIYLLPEFLTKGCAEFLGVLVLVGWVIRKGFENYMVDRSRYLPADIRGQSLKSFTLVAGPYRSSMSARRAGVP